MKVSTKVDALSTQSDKVKIRRLLSQLSGAPSGLMVRSYAQGRRKPLGDVRLSEVRSAPHVLDPGRGQSIRAFEISYSKDIGMNRKAGPKSFITSVEKAVLNFYVDVVAKTMPQRHYRRP